MADALKLARVVSLHGGPQLVKGHSDRPSLAVVLGDEQMANVTLDGAEARVFRGKAQTPTATLGHRRGQFQGGHAQFAGPANPSVFHRQLHPLGVLAQARHELTLGLRVEPHGFYWLSSMTTRVTHADAGL